MSAKKKETEMPAEALDEQEMEQVDGGVYTRNVRDGLTQSAIKSAREKRARGVTLSDHERTLLLEEL
ncbi:hypothetical protein LJC49_11195 [Ruminococcaceae bacterium OttesenSCG-928-I18]|nr:hypothetical protein [Ruminococcaceae bacterium OttesenSCG-928-I18]